MWHIVKRKLWTQRSELKMMLVMSSISLMMIFAFGGFNGSYQPRVLINDQDQTELSSKYISLLSEDKTHQYEVVTEEEGVQRVKESKALAMVTLEKGFSENLDKTFSGSLLKGVAQSSNEDQVPGLSFMSVKTDADTMVLQPLLLNRYEQMKNWHESSISLAKLAADKGENFEKVYEETYNKLQSSGKTKKALSLSISSQQSAAQKNAILMHSLIGFLIFFVAYSSVFGATDILTERKLNTWQRLLISPSSKFGMLVGNLIVSWVIGLIQLALVLFVGKYLFHIDFGGNIYAMFFAGSLFCLAMSGFGILLSSFAKSMQQIAALTSVALTAFGMIGGCLWPLDYVDNPILIGLSKVIPHTYAVKALTGISQGRGLVEVMPHMTVLAAMTAIFLIIGFLKLMGTEEQYQ